MKSGGYLIFDMTEALGHRCQQRQVYRSQHLEETALKINMEAAEMIARQVRLRDIGGIIIIDFIDMRNESPQE